MPTKPVGAVLGTWGVLRAANLSDSLHPPYAQAWSFLSPVLSMMARALPFLAGRAV